jgi:hypothetical protein
MNRNEMLQQHFEFDASDLQENHQGWVTETQRTIVKSRIGRFNLNALIVVIFILGVAAVVVTRGGFQTESGNMMSALKPVTGSLLSVALLIGFLVYRTSRKNDMSLQTAEGPVDFVWVEDSIPNHDNTSYRTVRSLQMRVDGMSFKVEETLMDIIKQGDICRFYYTGGGDIVSAEFIDKTE